MIEKETPTHWNLVFFSTVCIRTGLSRSWFWFKHCWLNCEVSRSRVRGFWCQIKWLCYKSVTSLLWFGISLRFLAAFSGRAHPWTYALTQVSSLSLSATCLWASTELSELHTVRGSCSRGEGGERQLNLIGLKYGCCRLGSHNRKWKDGSLDNCRDVARSVYEGWGSLFF